MKENVQENPTPKFGGQGVSGREFGRERKKCVCARRFCSFLCGIALHGDVGR
jgi:hypothetical protein